MYYAIISFIFLTIPHANKVTYTYTTEPITITATAVIPHTSEDVWLIAKCACSEALNQGSKGQQLVAEVIINRSRMKNQSFQEVIYAKGQFDGIRNKYFKRKPTTSCVMATVKAFYEPEMPFNTVYFANEKISTDRKWIRYLRTLKRMEYKDHTFYQKPIPKV